MEELKERKKIEHKFVKLRGLSTKTVCRKNLNLECGIAFYFSTLFNFHSLLN